MKTLVLFVLAFFAGVAGAAELQLEFGQCRFGQAHNGTYYQKPYDHRNYLTPACASVGIADRFAGSTWGYRVAFLQSGTIKARDNVAENNDGIYSPYACNQDGHVENCHSLIGGSGRMQGVSVSLTKDRALGAGWWTRGEAGLLFYRHHFNGYYTAIDYDRSGRVEGGGLDQRSSIVNNPIPLLGLTIGWKRLYAAARYHFPAMHRTGLSVTDGSFLQLTGGVAVAF